MSAADDTPTTNPRSKFGRAHLKACGPATLRAALAALQRKELCLDEKIGQLMTQRADCGDEMAAVLEAMREKGMLEAGVVSE